MVIAFLSILTATFVVVQTARAAYNPLREYTGSTFFDGWNYYGNYDNLTNGHTVYLAQDSPDVSKLAFLNEAGNAIIKVDDFSTVAWDNKRNSIRLESKDTYDIGTLWVLDAVHLPYGCSVWPAFWSKGAEDWPNTGEIDIIEYVNKMNHNQIALHSLPGCVQSPDVLKYNAQTGRSGETDCSIEKGTGGCVVNENKPGSNGEAFAQAGGGVWATQFEASGIYVWFWPRKDVPNSIKSATSSSSIDISDFGPPTAAYPSSTCDIAKHFAPQQLVLNIALCGDWADAPNVYNVSGLCTGLCYNDNVLGNGSNYKTAYFEIPYIRTYINSDSEANSTSSASSGPSGIQSSFFTTPTGSNGATETDGSTNPGGTDGGASSLTGCTVSSLLAVVLAVTGVIGSHV